MPTLPRTHLLAVQLCHASLRGVKTGLQSSVAQLSVLRCSRLLSQGFLESVLLIYGSCGLHEEEMAMVWHPTACSSIPHTSDVSPSPQHVHAHQSDAFQVLQ